MAGPSSVPTGTNTEENDAAPMVAILNLVWVPVVAFIGIAVPDKVLTLPIIAAFVVSLVHFLVLYRLRVPVKTGQMLGAMVAAMSVQWTVCRAVAQGLITEHLAFARTSKGGLSFARAQLSGSATSVAGASRRRRDPRRDGPPRWRVSFLRLILTRISYSPLRTR